MESTLGHPQRLRRRARSPRFFIPSLERVEAAESRIPGVVAEWSARLSRCETERERDLVSFQQRLELLVDEKLLRGCWRNSSPSRQCIVRQCIDSSKMIRTLHNFSGRREDGGCVGKMAGSSRVRISSFGILGD